MFLKSIKSIKEYTIPNNGHVITISNGAINLNNFVGDVYLSCKYNDQTQVAVIRVGLNDLTLSYNNFTKNILITEVGRKNNSDSSTLYINTMSEDTVTIAYVGIGEVAPVSDDDIGNIQNVKYDTVCSLQHRYTQPFSFGEGEPGENTNSLFYVQTA